MTFNELIRLLERNGFRMIKEKGSIRYYWKEGCPNLIRIDYHGRKEIPKGNIAFDSEICGNKTGE